MLVERPLWILYAGGLLWDRNSAPKGSVKSVSSVRKKLPSVKEMLTHTSCQQASRGNLTYYAPPCGGGVGGGATIFWALTCAQKRFCSICEFCERKKCSSWEKEMFFVRERKVLRERKKSPSWEIILPIALKQPHYYSRKPTRANEISEHNSHDGQV